MHRAATIVCSVEDANWTRRVDSRHARSSGPYIDLRCSRVESSEIIIVGTRNWKDTRLRTMTQQSKPPGQIRSKATLQKPLERLQTPRLPPKTPKIPGASKLHTAPLEATRAPTLPKLPTLPRPLPSATTTKSPSPRMLESIVAGSRAMGILKTAFAATGWTTLGATAGYVLWTRKTKIVDVPPTDYLFNSTFFARYNPNNAPVTQDLAIRKVPLTQIKPELLEKEGKLVEAFCAGVWSGLGKR